MSSKSEDKKKLILRTAMQLFAAKGSSATSMQEIADVCGMSKGSLYLHFKSKDELELSLFDYCYQLLQAALLQVDQDRNLSPKDNLIRKLEVLFELVLELRGFLHMQFKEWVKKGTLFQEPEIMNKHNAALLHYTKNTLTAAYGEEIIPYMSDLIVLSHGMIGTYAKMLFFPHMTTNTRQIAVYVISLLDSVVDHLLQKRPDPLISDELMNFYGKCRSCQAETEKHPLLVIKELKDLLEKQIVDEEQRQQADETLQILEQELLDSRPRRAILKGMIANLEDWPELGDKLRELVRLLQPYYA